jgi:hypothetical protein
LSTDGINPFNERMSDHNTWPVILTMYNIPTWLCQKRKYRFLNVIVSGPQQPGFDMDVFLEPVMEEFEKPRVVCLVWTVQRQDRMLSLSG